MRSDDSGSSDVNLTGAVRSDRDEKYSATMTDSRFPTLIKNRHRGERAVIVANGPSLNLMDLRFLRREITFGLNKIFLGFGKFHFYPGYYVAVNRKVIEQSVDEIRKLNCVKFISDKGEDLIQRDSLTYIISTKTPEREFYEDIALGVHEGWTVTFAALQIAYYMGFAEVVIIGMDHRFQYAGAPNKPSIMLGPDPNHFSPEYFSDGEAWDNPDLERSEYCYRKAREIYESSNRRIIDATVNGACNAFSKADYRDLFRPPADGWSRRPSG
jgi:hypothetical protein